MRAARLARAPSRRHARQRGREGVGRPGCAGHREHPQVHVPGHESAVDQRRHGRRLHRLLRDEAVRRRRDLRLQRRQLGRRAGRPEHRAPPAVPGDRLDHQLVQPVAHLGPLPLVGQHPGGHGGEQRLLAQVEPDHRRHPGVGRRVVGQPVAGHVRQPQQAARAPPRSAATPAASRSAPGTPRAGRRRTGGRGRRPAGARPRPPPPPRRPCAATGPRPAPAGRRARRRAAGARTTRCRSPPTSGRRSAASPRSPAAPPPPAPPAAAARRRRDRPAGSSSNSDGSAPRRLCRLASA